MNNCLYIINLMKRAVSFLNQGSLFSGLAKFHDISMIFPGFLVNLQVFFHYF